MVEWRELVPGEVWWTDAFLEPDTHMGLMRRLRNDSRKQIDGRQRSHAIGNTYYHYDLIKTDVRNDSALVEEVFTKLNSLVTSLGDEPVDFSKPLNQLQFFAKCFSADSRYDLHTESRTMFGKYVFVNYLTSEDSGELVFPSRHTAEEYLREHEDNRQGWDQTISTLAAEGTAVRYAGHLSLTPMRNRCVVFTTGVAHWVNPVLHSDNRLPRASLTGWINATDSYMSWEKNLPKAQVRDPEYHPVQPG
jgi:hypothetical protein